MNILSSLYSTFLYKPLFNILLLFYLYLPAHDFGLAVIVLTVIVKLILFPTSIKSIKSQREMSTIQPKIKEIKEKYKNDKERQSKELFTLYQKEKVNPFSGCLPLIIQLPILIALYQVFLSGFSAATINSNAYQFIGAIGTVKLTFLGIMDLTKPSIVLALLAGFFQFFQSKLSFKPLSTDKGNKSKTNIIQGQMTYFLPFITIFIVWKFGSLIGLYWVTNTIFSIAENLIISKKMGNLNK